jgi:apolipoprotein D and lipocalin family protein
MNALRWLLLGALLALLAGCTGVPDGIRPVHGFQVDRYLGTWHEIARLDHSFERGLTHITATYSRREDGGVDVLNRGWDAAERKWREAQGRAYFLDAPDVASLKVSFFGPFYGGYHVFALDTDYRWAMISGPSRDYLWILARQPELGPATLAPLLEQARRAGFDTEALIFPPHPKGDQP